VPEFPDLGNYAILKLWGPIWLFTLGLLAWITDKSLTVDQDFQASAEHATEASMWKLDQFLDPVVKASQVAPLDVTLRSPSKYAPELSVFLQMRSVINDVGAPLWRVTLCRILLWIIRISIGVHGILLIIWTATTVKYQDNFDEGLSLVLMYGIPLVVIFVAGTAQAILRFFVISR